MSAIILQACAHAWKMGHALAQTGTLPHAEDEIVATLQNIAAEHAEAYIAQVRQPLTPAEHTRLMLAYVKIFIKGVYDAGYKAAMPGDD